MLASVLLVSPAGLGAWLVLGRPPLPAAALGLAAVSTLVEVAYFVWLSRAYSLGEISIVYPLARGTAPLLAVVFGLVLLGERLSWLQAAGVGCLLIGIWTVRRPSLGKQGRAALVPALITGVCIAVYTAIDRIGVRLVAPWLYAWVLYLLIALALALWIRLPGRPAGAAPQLPGWGRAAAVGMLTLAAYGLVLFALSIAPLAVIAPVRESGIVFVSVWGIWRLRERVGLRWKLAGACATVLGAALLALAA